MISMDELRGIVNRECDVPFMQDVSMDELKEAIDSGKHHPHLDRHAPYINEKLHWVVWSECGYLDTGVVARGIGIKSFEKTQTDGLVDTYKITFDDERTEVIKIVNGRDGAPGKDGEGRPGRDGRDGADGKDGRDGKDYVLTDTDRAAIAQQAAEGLQPTISGISEHLTEHDTEIAEMQTEVAKKIELGDIPVASLDTLGMIKVNPNGAEGITLVSNGRAVIQKATDDNIRQRYGDYRAIVPKNLDYAVKSAMCDGKGAEWTESEKTEAKKRIGVDKLERDVKTLFKIGEGQTHAFEQVSSDAYSVDVPSGSLLAYPLSVGGKSVVWNQLISGVNDAESVYGITRISKGNGILHYQGTSEVSTNYTAVRTIGKYKVGHKYYVTLKNKNLPSGTRLSISTIDKNDSIINTSSADVIISYGLFINEGVSVDLDVEPRTHDLTQIFGAGNEPTSVDDPRIAMIERYAEEHPEYNDGSIISADVDKMVIRNATRWEQGYYNPSIQPTIITLANRISTSTRWSCKLGDTVKIKYDRIGSALVLITFKDGMPVGNVTYETANNDTLEKTILRECDSFCVEYFNNGATPNTAPKVMVYVNGEEQGISATISIPSSIRALDGYGWSAGSAYNEVDLENQMFVKRVKKIVLNGTEPWALYGDKVDAYNRMYFIYGVAEWVLNIGGSVCGSLINSANLNAQNISGQSQEEGLCLYKNGRIYISMLSSVVGNTTESFADYLKTHNIEIIFELAEPIITDISDILDSFEVEAGGSITFHQTDESLHLPVPSKVEYLVKLDEVGAT